MLGGKEGIEKRRKELQDREAERFMKEVETSLAARQGSSEDSRIPGT